MREIGAKLFDEETIRRRVEELGALISRDYAGRELVLLCVLKGACTFAADLMRSITLPVRMEFVQAASYGASTCSTESITIAHSLQTKDIEAKHVLVVDTIIDTGKTLGALLDQLRSMKPASLAVIVLLDKKVRRCRNITVAYKGFDVPDAFVVGYGMDFAQQYRNLPFIAVLESSS